MTEPDGRVERRHQHRVPHQPRRRRVRDQRPQVVDLRRRVDTAAASLIVMGKTDPDAPATPAAVDDPRAHRHARASPSSATCPCSATPTARATASSASRTCASRPPTCSARRAAGFAIAQARLGPGRIHHCMRCIGMAERALELMCRRVEARVAFGKRLAEQGVIQEWIADSRDRDRAGPPAHAEGGVADGHGRQQGRRRSRSRPSRSWRPTWRCRVVDRAIQAHGGGGVSDDFPLAAHVGRPAHAPLRRRPRRGAPPPGRPARAAAATEQRRA